MVSSRVVTVAAVGVSSTLALYLFARHVSRPRCVSAALPKTMKQLRVVEPNRDCAKIQLEVVEVEMPTPGRNEVLVRMVRRPPGWVRRRSMLRGRGARDTTEVNPRGCYAGGGPVEPQ
jgi:hypothetical protein